MTVALTDGNYWEFFMAHRDKEGHLRVYQMYNYWNIRTHGGFIIEMLKDMVSTV